MKKKKLNTLLVIFTLAFALACLARAQASAEEMKSFYDSEIPGIRVQVNATAETLPNQDITIVLNLTSQSEVTVKYLNLSIVGFINGTDRFLMKNITDNNFSLDSTSKKYNYTFQVPEHVWDTTYGELVLRYSVNYPVGSGTLIMPYNLTIAFPTTHVENVYVENLENSFRSLNDNYSQLNQTYHELQQNYTALQGTMGELDNTRRAVTVLAITTVFFVITTIYVVMRRPREYW